MADFRNYRSDRVYNGVRPVSPEKLAVLRAQLRDGIEAARAEARRQGVTLHPRIQVRIAQLPVTPATQADRDT